MSHEVAVAIQYITRSEFKYIDKITCRINKRLKYQQDFYVKMRNLFLKYIPSAGCQPLCWSLRLLRHACVYEGPDIDDTAKAGTFLITVKTLI